MTSHHDVETRLRLAGVIAAAEESQLLQRCADGDPDVLDALVRRRCDGEPLAWIVGSIEFAGTDVRVASGVYVPRWHSELLAERAIARTPRDGTVVDLCTGSGAIARAVAMARPDVVVVGTDIDPAAVACARSNGVTAFCGDLDAALPPSLRGSVDVVVSVPPYVPTDALALLPSDTFRYESARPYDGGPDGTSIERRAIAAASTLLRDGGALVLEAGGRQHEVLADVLAAHGFTDVLTLVDEEGDLRGLEATWRALRSPVSRRRADVP